MNKSNQLLRTLIAARTDLEKTPPQISAAIESLNFAKQALVLEQYRKTVKMDRLIEALSEPSSWAGLGVVAGAIAAAFPSLAYYAGGVATVCGAVAYWLKEGKPPQ